MGRFDGVMILTDMDGTLLDSQSRLSPENRDAILQFIAQGGRFSVATGRVKRAMEYFLPNLPLNAPAVLFNGSTVYDFQRGKTVWEKRLDHGPALAFAQDIMGRFPWVGVEVFLAEDEYVAQNNDRTRRHFQFVRLELKEKNSLEIPQPWVKFNLTGQANQMGELADYCQNRYGRQYFMQFSTSDFYEVMAAGANKGAGALAACRACGLSPNHLYTLGDGYNDKELMECAKMCFAPENAAEPIRRLAHRILPDNDHHTLAAAVQALEELYPEQ